MDAGSGREDVGDVEPAAQATANAGNYVITDLDAFEQGGAKTKFQDNIRAIETARKVSAEGRLATPEEQAIMAKYVGWGRSEFSEGLFKEYGGTAEKWEKERGIFKNLLGEEEFESARASTLNAHYTTPRLADAMWRMAGRMGFRSGRILEPAVGSGIFFGTMPGAAKERSSLVGVELDKVTAMLARYMYPGAKVHNIGYQEANLPDGWFDLVISNVPFADVRIREDRYNKLNAVLHDYYFLKSVKMVRPGGLVMFITSTGTMDKQNVVIRREIAKTADLVAAVRFPEGAFQKGAGTAVVTDMLILRRRAEGEAPAGAAWMDLKPVDVKDGDPLMVNEYFADHPEQILGKLDKKSRMYSEGNMHVSRTADFMDRVEAAVARLPEGVYKPRLQVQKAPAAEREMDVDSEVKDFGYEVKDGKLWQRVGGKMVERTAGADRIRQVKAVLGLRDVAREVVSDELAGKSEAAARGREELNKRYDAYVKVYGPIHGEKSRRLIADDPDWPNVMALEVWDSEEKTAKKADIFRKATVRPDIRPDKAETVQDALTISLNETGEIDLERMGKLLGRPPAGVEEELVKNGLAYLVPGGGVEVKARYLSGNVKEKLLQARAAAEMDRRYQANVDALEKVIPKDLNYAEISAGLGSPWIPSAEMQTWVSELLGTRPDGMRVQYIPSAGKWVVEIQDRLKWEFQRNAAFNQTYGTPRRNFQEILQAALDNRSIVVMDSTKDGSVLNVEATQEANFKVEQVKEMFVEWLWKDPDRRMRLTRYYNDNFRNMVEFKDDGKWMRFPDLNMAMYPNGPRDHQYSAVAKVLQAFRVFLAHEVGTGKTLTYALTARMAKRVGLANKPLLVCLKRNIEQVTDEIQRAFPTMRILSTNELFDKDSRRQTIARVATGDWDLVVMTHDQFNMLDVDKDVEERFIQMEIAELDAVMAAVDPEAAPGSKKRDKRTKELEKMRQRLQEKLKDALSRPRDPGVTFQKMGVDMLMVDEAHYFKSLPVYTTRGRVKGIPQTRSERGTNMQMQVQWLRDQSPKAVVVFGSGTPLDNSMVEIYNWQKYLQPEELEARGIQSFDGWASTFGLTTSETEPTAKGTFEPTARFRKFVNMAELAALSRQFFDVKFVSDMPDVKRPERKDEVRAVPASDVQSGYLRDLQERAKQLKGRRPEKGADNMLAICTDGRKCALHPGLVNRDWVGERGKVDVAIEDALKYHKAHPDLTMMIFSDLGVNKTEWGFGVYEYIIDRLVEGGIPRAKIINFATVKDGEKTLDAIADLREGRAIVGIGSTQKLGTGVNAQKKLRWLLHVDAPMTPGRLTQRDGRGWRQGNTNKVVGIVRYVTAPSLDAFTWSLINNKSKMFEQFFRHGMEMREMDELDAEVMSPARVMAEAAGNPDIVNAVDLQEKVKRLEARKRSVARSVADAELSTRKYQEKENKDREWLEVLKKVQAPAREAMKEEFGWKVGKKVWDKRGDDFFEALEGVLGDQVKESGYGASWTEAAAGEIRGVPVRVRVKKTSYGVEVEGGRLVLKGEEIPFGHGESVRALVLNTEATLSDLAGGVFIGAMENRIREHGLNRKRLEGEAARKFDQEEELARLKKELSDTMARLAAADKEGAQDLRTKVVAAEDRLERAMGPATVAKLREHAEKAGMGDKGYLKQLEAEIARVEKAVMEPEVEEAREEGDQVKDFRAAPAGSAGSGFGTHNAPTGIDLPELVELTQELVKGGAPRVRRSLRGRLGTLGRMHYNRLDPHIEILARTADRLTDEEKAELRAQAEEGASQDPDWDDLTRAQRAIRVDQAYRAILKTARDEATEEGRRPDQALQILGHEIGHAADWLDDMVDARGNILGHIAALHKYMKGMMAAERMGGVEELPEKDRRSVMAEVREELGDGADPKEIKEKYRARLAVLAESRGVVTRDAIVAELKALTQWWNPFDEAADGNYTQYRHDPSELYADALSVMLNNPEELRRRAPMFVRAWEGYRDARPEVKAAWDKVFGAIASGAHLDRRRERIRAGFEKAEENRAKVLKGKEAIDRKVWRQGLKAMWLDLHAVTTEMVGKLPRGAIEAEKNPRFGIEEALASGALAELYAKDVNDKVLRVLARARVDDATFGEFLVYRRVLKERTDIFNPAGLHPAAAKEQLEHLEKVVGPERMEAMRQAAANLAEVRRVVVEKVIESGLSDPDGELAKKMRDNDAYVKFNVAEYLARRYGEGVGGRIYKQYGTMKEIENPLTATVLQDVSLIKAAFRNAAKREQIEMLAPHYPEEIRPARMRWDSGKQVPVASDREGEAVETYLDEGKVKAWYVPYWMAAAWDRESMMGIRIAGQALRWILATPVWRGLFVRYNPGFVPFNIKRDLTKLYRGVPGLSRMHALRYWLRAFPDAWSSVFGTPTDLAREVMGAGALIAQEEWDATADEDKTLARMLARYGILLPGREWQGSAAGRVLRALGVPVRIMGDVNTVFERQPKMAAWKAMKERRTDVGARERAHIVRWQAGSPFFLAKAGLSPILNNLFLFSDAMRQGLMAETMLLTEGRTGKAEYAWKLFSSVIFGKMLRWLLRAGILGGTALLIGGDKRDREGRQEMRWQEWWELVPDEDLRNYQVFPLGVTENGKAVYLRVPVDEEARMVGGLTWSLMQKEYADAPKAVTGYVAGQAPNLSPLVGAVKMWVDYTQGKNPYDDFRGKNVLDDATFKARDGRAVGALAKETANQLGASIVYRFQGKTADEVKSELEKGLDVPVVNNVVGRWIRVSDRGLSQKIQKEAVEPAQKERAREVLDLRDALGKIVEGEALSDKEMAAVARDLSKADPYLHDAAKRMMANRYGGAWVRALMQAQSVQEKIKILELMQKQESGEK